MGIKLRIKYNSSKEGGKSLQIRYSKIAAKTINNLDKSIKQRIKSGVEGLAEIPPKGDIKKMQGFDPPIFRLRIGKYRIIYEYVYIEEMQEVLLIKDIGSRGDIYN